MNKTSYTTRFSYAASDVAGQLVFTFIIGGYLSKFFTDVYGLPAITCGYIIAIARWIDAIDAPIWGIIFDKTHSRWGKSRPWFLWLCMPFATFGVLTFQTPALGHTAKIWYAAITYIACNVLYTGINTPVTSILSALTPDPHERVTLTCFRMFGSKLGVLIVNLTALKLVAWLGAGSDRRGFVLGISVTLALGVLFVAGVLGIEWPSAIAEGITPDASGGAAVFFMMTGMHALHVVTGLIFLAVVLRKGLKGMYSQEKHWGVEAAAVYWHFVDVVWIFFYPALYLIGKVL